MGILGSDKVMGFCLGQRGREGLAFLVGKDDERDVHARTPPRQAVAFCHPLSPPLCSLVAENASR